MGVEGRGVTWDLLKEATETNGATDLEMDPRTRRSSTPPSGATGSTRAPTAAELGADHERDSRLAGAACGEPDPLLELGLSHPVGQVAVLYAGFDWVDAEGYHPSRVFKSTDVGRQLVEAPQEQAARRAETRVEDYCGGQCFYDNNVDVDPTNPNIVT